MLNPGQNPWKDLKRSLKILRKRSFQDLSRHLDISCMIQHDHARVCKKIQIVFEGKSKLKDIK